MNELIDQITEILSDFDESELQSQIDSIAERRAKLANIDRSKYKNLSFFERSSAISEEQINAAGGKHWLSLLRCGDETVIKEIKRNQEAKIAKRNAKIAQKIEQTGAVSIKRIRPSNSGDGFNGSWVVSTENGDIRIILTVIVAAGPIQCLHNRVLVKVRNMNK